MFQDATVNLDPGLRLQSACSFTSPGGLDKRVSIYQTAECQRIRNWRISGFIAALMMELRCLLFLSGCGPGSHRVWEGGDVGWVRQVNTCICSQNVPNLSHSVDVRGFSMWIWLLFCFISYTFHRAEIVPSSACLFTKCLPPAGPLLGLEREGERSRTSSSVVIKSTHGQDF